jgi:hypothetical protein
MVRSSTGNVEILLPLMSSFTSLRYAISKQSKITHINLLTSKKQGKTREGTGYKKIPVTSLGLQDFLQHSLQRPENSAEVLKTQRNN